MPSAPPCPAGLVLVQLLSTMVIVIYTSGEKKTIFPCTGLGRSEGDMNGPPALYMITMVDMDVLEQCWLAQRGLATARAPHDDGGEAGERPDCGDEAGRAQGPCQG